MPFDLDGTPIQVLPPAVPVFRPAPPSPPQLTVIPVQGPQGPQGIPGDAGAALAFVHAQSTPVTTLQIIHGLPFRPSGIQCLETDGTPSPLGIGVSYPSVGIIELNFGTAAFSGTIYLS
jgi:hypothetical protein